MLPQVDKLLSLQVDRQALFMRSFTSFLSNYSKVQEYFTAHLNLNLIHFQDRPQVVGAAVVGSGALEIQFACTALGARLGEPSECFFKQHETILAHERNTSANLLVG